MIRMSKGSEPKILFDNHKKWTTSLLIQLASSKKPNASLATKYRHKKIKEALVQETKGKCVYCESKILHIHHGDVEHILPKSIYANQTFTWQNLTLACEICNQNKSNNDPNLNFILNPYLHDPAMHIRFAGPWLVATTNEGENTKVLLDLNRTPLYEKRLERMQGIESILKKITDLSMPLPTRKIIFKDFIKNELSNASEYSAMVSSFFKNYKDVIPSDVLS